MSKLCSSCDYTRSVTQYFKEISKYKPLNKEEEKNIIKKAQDGDENARNTIVVSNLAYVINVAKYYKGRGVSMDELISEGNLGLLRAIETFDTQRDVKFITYAVWWIKSFINNTITNTLKNNYESLDECVIMGESENYEDDVDSYNSNDLNNNNNSLYYKEDGVNIQSLLGCLEGRDLEIINNYYGFGDNDSITLEELGKKYNISAARVMQIKDKILTKLRCEILNNKN